jgi:hypothetical protein
MGGLFTSPLIPANAGTQVFLCNRASPRGSRGEMNAATKRAWVPAFAGMTGGEGQA